MAYAACTSDNVYVCVADFVARSGVGSLGGSLVPGLGQVNRFNDGTDQLRVSHSANVHVTSALSPHSLIFLFSDSGFASSSSSLSSSSALPTGTPSASSALHSSSFFSSSFLSSSLGGVPSVSSSISSSPLPPPPPPPLPSVAPPALSLAPGRPRSGVSLPPPPGFPSISLSLSSLPSSSFVASAPPPSVFLLPTSAPLSAPSVSSLPPVSSSFSSASSSSFLDFASYQAQVLVLSREYQLLARWY